ncbi:hypothetical protein FVE85_0866 [Porphyridium purpureum]|uniref:Uncharacterized protein n=1 Tax=Porphyridium purpureum TaxID=35688 RepID=A0A5J4Z3D4_PORPP|nr:hypothetical protein FVE85_0866 [Porphyridium purpureum]|eukprot:POR1551..scf208_2
MAHRSSPCRTQTGSACAVVVSARRKGSKGEDVPLWDVLENERVIEPDSDSDLEDAELSDDEDDEQEDAYSLLQEDAGLLEDEDARIDGQSEKSSDSMKTDFFYDPSMGSFEIFDAEKGVVSFGELDDASTMFSQSQPKGTGNGIDWDWGMAGLEDEDQAEKVWVQSFGDDDPGAESDAALSEDEEEEEEIWMLDESSGPKEFVVVDHPYESESSGEEFAVEMDELYDERKLLRDLVEDGDQSENDVLLQEGKLMLFLSQMSQQRTKSLERAQLLVSKKLQVLSTQIRDLKNDRLSTDESENNMLALRLREQKMLELENSRYAKLIAEERSGMEEIKLALSDMYILEGD